MELEIKGFIEFCKAISFHPTEVGKSEQLVKALSFCLNGVSNCDCSNKPSTENFEKKYWRNGSIYIFDNYFIKVFTPSGDYIRKFQIDTSNISIFTLFL